MSSGALFIGVKSNPAGTWGDKDSEHGEVHNRSDEITKRADWAGTPQVSVFRVQLDKSRRYLSAAMIPKKQWRCDWSVVDMYLIRTR